MNTSLSSNNPTVASLFASANANGTITNAAAAVVVPNMTANIQAALGVSVDDVQASNVVLVTIVLDDSSSIAFNNNEATLIDGANVIIDAIGASKEDGLLVCIRRLNAGTLCPFTPLAQAPRVNHVNYKANGGTPLYDNVAETMGLVLAKTQDFTSNGVPVRSVTIVVTDGADYGSRAHTRPESVKPIIDDAHKAEQHIVCAMGIDDGSTNFRDIFGRMGIPDRWILTPKNNPSEIRAAFIMASKSAARASVAAPGAFSATAGGGFGAP